MRGQPRKSDTRGINGPSGKAAQAPQHRRWAAIHHNFALQLYAGRDAGKMKTTLLPEKPDAKSPAGADIRFIMDGESGNMIHSTVPPHQTNRATVHATVSEFWFVLEGRGEIWRDDGVDSCITDLVPGTSIDIPAGTAFQYRNVSDQELKFICIAMPPWPGDSEATYLDGIWEPTI